MPNGASAAWGVFSALAVALTSAPAAADPRGVARYRAAVEPLVDQFCASCHSGRSAKGGVSFDADPPALVADTDLWAKSLRMVRADLMPPKGKDRPTPDEVKQLTAWVTGSVFRIDPADPDPGRVTLRRLNRVEYRNTVRDLLGVDYDTDAEFPPDDTGHGFDTLGEVLTLSPLLLEKYLAAAHAVVGKAVPSAPRVPAERRIPGQKFGGQGDGPLRLSYYEPATATHTFAAPHAGRYQLVADLTASERFVDGVFDYNKCRLVFKADGEVLHDAEYTRQGGRPYRLEFDRDWTAGDHMLTFEVKPLTPAEKQVRSLNLRVDAVTVRGPMAPDHWVKPASHERFFPDPAPADPAGKREAARKLLAGFAAKAFRRPADPATLDRLVRLAEEQYSRDGGTFEAGVGRAMTAVLASPRFLFRDEAVVPDSLGKHPFVDEYSLASRLSYFLWSSMPDDELFRLAGENKLRANLPAQMKRMLADPKSGEFVRNFVGQWLQTRAIDTVQINAAAVAARDDPPDPAAQERRNRFRELIRKPAEALTEAEKAELAAARASFGGGRRGNRVELTGPLREAMRRETEMLFEYVVREDRPLLDLIDGDYTFLNERLARHYGIDGVSGDQMRRVKLPADSPRGGVLTQGTVLAVTSNPDRTSPVKRGLFILDNVLGTPPPPAPPDVPSLDDAATKDGAKPATLRDALAAHRSQAVCASCHNRMDPLGLALENFNALGIFRAKERNAPIDPAGELISGEAFTNVRELKKVLATSRRTDFYRCVTEKVLMYAVGRGLEPTDTLTIDEIVDRLEKAGGRPSVLLAGVIESAPFQKRRRDDPTRSAADAPKP